MSDIKRYDVTGVNDDVGCVAMPVLSETGKFVTYSDHLSALAEKDREREEAERALDYAVLACRAALNTIENRGDGAVSKPMLHMVLSTQAAAEAARKERS